MVRSLAVLGLALLACSGRDATRDASGSDAGLVDAAAGVDAIDCDGGCAAMDEVCGDSPSDRDAGALPCGPGLVCCYPCGIPDCADRCTAPCTPGPGCQEGGCPGPFP